MALFSVLISFSYLPFIALPIVCGSLLAREEDEELEDGQLVSMSNFRYLLPLCSKSLVALASVAFARWATICYVVVDKFRDRLNRVLMIEITFASLIIHYYFYGFALEHLSPYFFLMESLHGVEYSISLSTSVELGYYFAREVEVLLPELMRRGIINQDDNNVELVKVSLMATMSGCYTLVYDGFGCILGSLIFGIITGQHSFIATWITIGSLAVVGFVTILFVYSVGKCFKIRPEILRMRDRQLASGQLEASESARASD